MPGELGQVAHTHDGEQHDQVEPLPHVATRHLEQVRLLKLLKHTTFQFDKLTKKTMKYHNICIVRPNPTLRPCTTTDIVL